MSEEVVKDAINPDHYKKACDIECIDAIIMALGEDGAIQMCLGNIIKYLWRMEHKNNPLENLDKAEWYFNKAVELTKLRYGYNHDIDNDDDLMKYKHIIDRYTKKYAFDRCTKKYM